MHAMCASCAAGGAVGTHVPGAYLGGVQHACHAQPACTAALQVAQQLFFATAEFRATNLHVLTGAERQPASQSAVPLPLPHRFKAVVVSFGAGMCKACAWNTRGHA